MGLGSMLYEKKKNKKHSRRKIVIFFLVLIIIIVIAFEVKAYASKIGLLNRIDSDNCATINYYDIYGIHFNLKGNIKVDNNVDNLKLVLTNGSKEEIIPWEINKKSGKYSFSTSDYINGGINLENLSKGNYYLLIKGKCNNKTTYYSLKNNTVYDDLEYYTLTKNSQNNKININWDKYNNKFLLNVKITQTTLPDNVYDITIDPGHDANDSGKMACSDGSPVTSNGKCLSGKLYKEADVNLAVSLE